MSTLQITIIIATVLLAIAVFYISFLRYKLQNESEYVDFLKEKNAELKAALQKNPG